MKQWKWLLGAGAVLLAVCAWADEFKFVSILSGPVASFDHVETKACAVTKATSESKFNAGSEESTGGIIGVYGAPIQVGSVHMDYNTQIATADNISEGNPISWLVGSLQVGSNGEVHAQKVIANTVMLLNDEKGATLNGVTETQVGSLIINNSAWAEEGAANGSLRVWHENSATGQSDLWFSFEGGSEGKQDATWIQIGSNGETLDASNAQDVYYPITTAK